jgi:hypothetical protein
MWNEYESEALWSNSADPELTLKAIETDWYVLQFASRELLSSREFMLKAVAVEGRALRSASAALRNDREVVLVAVKQFGSVLSAASDALRDDYDVVLTAVDHDPHALRFASNRLKNNHAIVLKAVIREWFVLPYASKEIQTGAFIQKLKYMPRGKGWWYILKLKWRMRNFVVWRLGNVVAASDAAHFAPDGKVVMATPGAQAAKRKFDEMAGI